MKLTIHLKMVIGFAVVICIMIAGHLYMLFEIQALSNEAQTTLNMEVKALDIAKRMRALLNDEESHARKYLITRDPVYYDLFREASREFQQLLGTLIRTEAERGNALHQVAEKHHWLSRSIPEPGKPATGDTASTGIIENGARTEQVESIDRWLTSLIRTNQISIDSSMATFVESTHRAKLVAAALTLLTILAASAAAWMIARTITRPIGTLVRATRQIAQGRFDPIRVNSHDETALLAESISDMSAKLKRVNEAKADLMHQIVHELRNPLQIIFFARNLLAEQEVGGVNGKQLEMLDLIGCNAEKLMSFTDQFLDLAKVEAGMMEYRRAPTDLVALVTRAVEDARAFASRKNISIKLLSEPVPQTFADGEKLSQVFGNLLSNAIKYTEQGGSVAAAVFGFDRKIYVAVKDSGIGIATEELPKLFIKFYQAANAAKAHVKGTGLGLALVKAFVEGHGGALYVTSTIGVGSTFTVELPVVEAGRVELLDAAQPV
ncbi:MAG: ATP-binding protein [Candidatus Binatia bacterium]